MNPLSTVEFAHECVKAGFWPNVTLFPYCSSQELMQKAIDLSPDNTIISASHDILNLDFSNLKIVEFIAAPNTDLDFCVFVMKKLKNRNIEIIYKCPRILEQGTFLIPYADCIELKTVDAAGYVNNSVSIEEQIDLVTQKYNKPYIISGGISNSNDVKYWFEKGAHAVCVGTIIAPSKESIMSDNTKNLLIKANEKHLSKFNTGQQGIILSKIENDDFNHTQSHNIGIKTGFKGHIYTGKAVNNINEILSLSQIYSNLTK